MLVDIDFLECYLNKFQARNLRVAYGVFLINVMARDHFEDIGRGESVI